MCRYAFKTYKSHYACFKCRKTFKQAPYTDLLERTGKLKTYEKLKRRPDNKLRDDEIILVADLDKNFRDREIKCPQCAGYMADLGLDFKSPKQQAVKEWAVIEGLYIIGKNFHSCGCTGIGYIPKKTGDYHLYLQDRLVEYEKQLGYYQQQSLHECDDKAERVEFWSERVQVIKSELIKQKMNL